MQAGDLNNVALPDWQEFAAGIIGHVALSKQQNSAAGTTEIRSIVNFWGQIESLYYTLAQSTRQCRRVPVFIVTTVAIPQQAYLSLDISSFLEKAGNASLSFLSCILSFDRA